MNEQLLNKQLLFIDLDGTLIRTASGETFPKNIADFVIRQDTVEALRKICTEGNVKYIAVVSNQGGVSLGYVTSKDMHIKIRSICDIIEAMVQSTDKSVVVSFSFCTSNDKAHESRKPNTGMLESTLLTLSKSFKQRFSNDQMLMVGDASGLPGQYSDTDAKTAENFGIDYLDVEEFIKNCNDNG